MVKVKNHAGAHRWALGARAELFAMELMFLFSEFSDSPKPMSAEGTSCADGWWTVIKSVFQFSLYLTALTSTMS